MKTIASFFRFDHYRTSFRKETVAGITTFLTMAYIIIVNPAILEAGGIPRGPQTTATILAAVFGCVVMALWANRPFAIAPYMSENAFVAFTVVKTLGYTWQTAMGAVFVAGIVFSILTVFRVRSWLAEAIPLSLKCAFAVGIGLFLTFIGLNETGLVTLGVAGAPVKMGNIAAPSVLLAVFGYLLTVFLMTRQVRGAIVIGIVATTTLSIAFGVTPMPKEFVSLPPDISPILFQLDIGSVFEIRFFPVVLTIFIMAFLDTVGTLIGLSMRADLLDEHGNLPEIEKPMLADALATTVAPLLGTTTTGAYIESAAGIEEGGAHRFHGPRRGGALPPGPLLRSAVHHRPLPRLRHCPHRHRLLHDRAHQADRIRRLHRAGSRLPHHRPHDFHLQHRRRHEHGAPHLSAPQGRSRPGARGAGRHVGAGAPGGVALCVLS